MTRSEIVDTTYRVLPADLLHGEHRLTISAVSLQGLEAIQPIAHFLETRKRLVLTQEHCRTLILLTGSTLFEDWVGITVRIRVDTRGPQPSIQILPIALPRLSLQGLDALLRRFSRRRPSVPIPSTVLAHPSPQLSPLSPLAQSDSVEKLPESFPRDDSDPASALPRRWTASESAPHPHGVAWRELALPGLVIVLLSMVSFLYGRAYGPEILTLLEVILQGNGR